MNDNAVVTEPQGGGRSIWLVGAIVAIVLVVVAAAAIFVVNDQQDAEYAAGSPEAAFQAYARAWGSGDTDTAWAALTTRAQERLSEHEFRHVNVWQGDEARRVWIDERTGTDERAVLHLSIETIYDGGLFGSDRYTEDARVTLVLEEGEWKIDTPLVGYEQWFGYDER